MSNYVTVFEYDYIVDSASYVGNVQQDRRVHSIDTKAYLWFRNECLKIDGDTATRWLRLKRVNGKEAIQVTGFAGLLQAPDGYQIEVLPKIGRANENAENSREILIKMLMCLADFPHFQSSDASLETQKNLPLLEVFIHQFLLAVETVIRRGLRSDYITREDNLFALRGKLLMSQHLKQNLVRRDRFFTAHDEYSPDRPENRLLRTALEKVLKMTRLSSNQKMAQEHGFVFNDISLSKDVKKDIDNIRIDRGMHHYEAALAWAKLILTNQSPLTGRGDANAISLMFPMEKLFEAYVGKHLRLNLKKDYQFERTPKKKYLVKHDNSNWFRLEPDFRVYQKNGIDFILDAKWKLLDQSKSDSKDKYGLSQADFYQLFAYGQFYLEGKGTLVLIYPKTDRFDKPLQCFKFLNDSNPALKLTLWVLPFCLKDKKLILPDDPILFDVIDCLPIQINMAFNQ